MRSVYPDDIIRHVLQRLDSLDVLEYLDYHPESMQRDGAKVRMFCPIHGESVRRTLTVYLDERRYLCSQRGCPGSQGGDLIDLIARAHRLDYDVALRRLVDEFALEVDLPRDQESVNQALVEAENLLALVSMGGPQTESHTREAHARLDRVLEENPSNPLALRLKFRFLQLSGAPAADVAPWIIRLVDIEEEAGSYDDVREVLETELVREPGNLAVRRRLAEHLRSLGETDESLEQYLLLAEYSEARGELASAIRAYRDIQSLGDTGFDAAEMITQLLLATNDREAAVSELLRQAQEARNRGDQDGLVHALETAVEIEPKNGHLAVQLIDAWMARELSDREAARAAQMCDDMIARGEWKLATRALEALASARPEDPAVLGHLVRLHRQGGTRETAIELLRRKARLHLHAEENAEARETLEELLSLAPRDVSALRQLAEAARDDGETEEAVRRFRTLANLCREEGNNDGALLAMRELYHIAPEDRRAVLDYVTLLLQLDHKGDAITTLEQTVEKLSVEKQTHDLRRLVEQGLQLAPDNPCFLLRFAAVLEQEGNRDRATEIFLQACHHLLITGKAPEAEERLRELISRRGQLPHAMELLAEALVADGREEAAAEELLGAADRLSEEGIEGAQAARTLLEKVNAIHPHDERALERLVEINTLLQDPEQTLWSHERLMLLLKESGRVAEAIRHGRQILALDPRHMEGHRELVELYKLAEDHESWKRGVWQLSRLYRDSRDFEQEKSVLRGLLQEDAADLDARERLLELVAPRAESTALTQSLTLYLEHCEPTNAWSRAAAFLRNLDEEHPGNAAIQRALIEVLAKTNESRERSERLRSLIDEHRRREEFTEAIALYEELIRLKPAALAHREALGELLVQTDDHEYAASVLAALARERIQTAELDAAAANLEQAVSLDAKCAEAHQLLAEVALTRGRDDRAIGHLMDAAQCLSDSGEHEEALETLERAISLHPRNLTPRRRRIAILLHRDVGRTGEAIAELDELGAEQLTRGDEQGGFQSMREALALAPGDAERRRELGEQLGARDRTEEAVHVLLDGAEHALTADDVAAAENWCTEALEMEPEHPRARTLHAEILERQGRHEEALREWRAVAPLLRGSGTESGTAPKRGRSHGMAPTLPLMEEYTFDRFVVGDRNRFAWATARAVAQAPGKTPHNPLFIHADVGLGKTHLMQAVAHHIMTSNAQQRVIYTSAEDFTTELIEAIQSNSVERFRQRYKLADLLLLDDVHFLAGKERAQEEFFHIFNTLYQGGIQVIVTSDRPPGEIARLEQRLLSRFGAGVIVDIQQPELETRLAILRRSCDEMPDVNVPPETLSLLAENVPSNVRDLKAALNQLMMLHRAGGRNLGPDTAREAIRQRVGRASVPSSEATP